MKKGNANRGSPILNAVHETAMGFHRAGAIDDSIMREFDALCLPPVKEYTPREIKRIRNHQNVSQFVFAAYLNVARSTVVRWEQGEKKPQGASLKLLDLVDRKGLEALA